MFQSLSFSLKEHIDCGLSELIRCKELKELFCIACNADPKIQQLLYNISTFLSINQNSSKFIIDCDTKTTGIFKKKQLLSLTLPGALAIDPNPFEKKFAIQMSAHLKYVYFKFSHYPPSVIEQCWQLYQQAYYHRKSYALSCGSLTPIAQCENCEWWPVICFEQLCISCQKKWEHVSYTYKFKKCSKNCTCTPISVIAKSYFVSTSFKGGEIQGLRGYSLRTPHSATASLAKPESLAIPPNALEFKSNPEEWSLAKNDAWILGVINANHTVYLQVNNHPQIFTKNGKKWLNFFQDPLNFIWDIESKRLRVTGREIILLIEHGYKPYYLPSHFSAKEMKNSIFLGFKSPARGQINTVTLEKFREIIDKVNNPFQILDIMQNANWLSIEAVERAKYQFGLQKSFETRSRQRSHSF